MSLLMAWRGMNDDQGIYWSTFDGNAWAPQRGVPNVGSDVGPQLASFGGQVHMAWKGIHGDQGIYHSWFDGQQWAPQDGVAGIGSSSGPGLVAALGKLVMAWKGVEGDDHIWFSTSFDGSTWAPQTTVPGASTISRPALATLPGSGDVYMVWNDSRGVIWWSIYSGQWSSPQQAGVAVDPYPTTLAVTNILDTAPRAVAGSEVMLIAAEGSGGLNENYVATSTFDGSRWTLLERVVDGTSPSVTLWPGEHPGLGEAVVYMVGRERYSQSIWWTRFVRGRAAAQQTVFGIATHGSPAVVFSADF